MIIISIIYIKMFWHFYKANVMNICIQLQWYVNINKSPHLRNYTKEEGQWAALVFGEGEGLGGGNPVTSLPYILPP